jgi:hypothetical protein
LIWGGGNVVIESWNVTSWKNHIEYPKETNIDLSSKLHGLEERLYIFNRFNEEMRHQTCKMQWYIKPQHQYYKVFISYVNNTSLDIYDDPHAKSRSGDPKN